MEKIMEDIPILRVIVADLSHAWDLRISTSVCGFDIITAEVGKEEAIAVVAGKAAAHFVDCQFVGSSTGGYGREHNNNVFKTHVEV